MFMVFHEPKYICLSATVMSYLCKTKYEFYFSTAFHVRIFHFSQKNPLIESASSSEDLSAYSISWAYVDWCKFCIHLRSLSVRHF
jgi:hypothetical protein